MTHETRPAGRLTMRKVPLIRRPHIENLDMAMHFGLASLRGRFTRKGRWQAANRKNFERSLEDQDAFDRGTLGHNRLGAIGHLWLAKVRLDGAVEDYGLVSCRVVTTAGVGYIVDAFQNLTELENMKYHGVGTGSTAEAASQTALVTELTTQYSSSNIRPTGTLGEQSGNANVYETTATVTVSATAAITEHGIFSQAAVGAASSSNVMLDRSVFSVINLASGESLVATYDLTLPSGG
jgi:hypothetical protein